MSGFRGADHVRYAISHFSCSRHYCRDDHPQFKRSRGLDSESITPPDELHSYSHAWTRSPPPRMHRPSIRHWRQTSTDILVFLRALTTTVDVSRARPLLSRGERVLWGTVGRFVYGVCNSADQQLRSHPDHTTLHRQSTDRPCVQCNRERPSACVDPAGWTRRDAVVSRQEGDVGVESGAAGDDLVNHRRITPSAGFPCGVNAVGCSSFDAGCHFQMTAPANHGMWLIVVKNAR